MMLLKGKTLVVAGLAMASLAMSGCDDAKNAKRGTADTPAAEVVSGTDSDGDGLPDSIDLCKSDAFGSNPASGDLIDVDDDGLGNNCDDDDDNDLVKDAGDNCPLVDNKDQLNSNSTPAGNACEDDFDGDTKLNGADNCPATPNVDQNDMDNDGIGDRCDDSNDLDGVPDLVDNCPFVSNRDQANADGDALGDACDGDDDNDTIVDGADNCPLTPNPGQNGALCLTDSDNDTVDNDKDNCPFVSNANQTDKDNNDIGDACQDDDGDGIVLTFDNCPALNTQNLSDVDRDGLGDECDPDNDNDRVLNADDNCDFTANADQKNSDKDIEEAMRTPLVGDACEDDRDNDLISDDNDSCPTVPNGREVGNDPRFCAPDSDGDGVTDPVDNCPAIANTLQTNTDVDTEGDACDTDDDNDGRVDTADNCPFVSNADQKDSNQDGGGDACSNDFDVDGVLNINDNCPNNANPNQADLDRDGIGNICDTDSDNDGVEDGIDNCDFVANPDQSVNPCSTAASMGNLTCSTYATGTVTPVISGALCGQVLDALGQPLGLCSVSSPASAADSNPLTYASINNSVVLPDSLIGNNLTGEVGVNVQLPTARPVGAIAALEVEVPGGTLDLTLFRNIVVRTYLDGMLQEERESLSTNPIDGFSLDLLGMSPVGSNSRALIGFISTKPFDSVELTVAAGVSVDVLEQLRVHDTCSIAEVAESIVDPAPASPVPTTPEGFADILTQGATLLQDMLLPDDTMPPIGQETFTEFADQLASGDFAGAFEDGATLLMDAVTNNPITTALTEGAALLQEMLAPDSNLTESFGEFTELLTAGDFAGAFDAGSALLMDAVTNNPLAEGAAMLQETLTGEDTTLPIDQAAFEEVAGLIAEGDFQGAFTQGAEAVTGLFTGLGG